LRSNPVKACRASMILNQKLKLWAVLILRIVWTKITVNLADMILSYYKSEISWQIFCPFHINIYIYVKSLRHAMHTICWEQYSGSQTSSSQWHLSKIKVSVGSAAVQPFWNDLFSFILINRFVICNDKIKKHSNWQYIVPVNKIWVKKLIIIYAAVLVSSILFVETN